MTNPVVAWKSKDGTYFPTQYLMNRYERKQILERYARRVTYGEILEISRILDDWDAVVREMAQYPVE